MSARVSTPKMALGGATALLGAIAFAGGMIRVPVLAQVGYVAAPPGKRVTKVVPNPSPLRNATDSGRNRALPSGSTTVERQSLTYRSPQGTANVQSRKPSEVTAVVLAGGDQLGSAVVLRQTSGGSWLVTNRHVVDGESNVCVRSGDGRLWPGATVLPRQAGGLDVAFLWLPGAMGLATATPSTATNKVEGSWGFPVVRAAGYPVGEQPKAQPPAFRELKGLLLPLLPKPLEGGMQLATTAAVRKGMSGGGLFDGEGRLIGLTTTHADPLWPAPLREEGGKALPPELNQRLELVALAIPLSRILPLLKELKPPVTESQPERNIRVGSARAAIDAGQQAVKVPSLAEICNDYLW